MLFVLLCINYLAAMDHASKLGEYFDAIQKDKVVEMQRLLENGIDVNASNRHGESGLWVACCHHSYKCVERLLQYSGINVDTNSPTTTSNRTPLHFVCIEKDQTVDIKHFIALLLSKQADPNKRNGYERTVLEEVVHDSDNIIALEQLIAAGAWLGRAKDQKTPFEEAILRRHHAQIEEFLRIIPSLRQEGIIFLDQMIADPDWSSDKKTFEEIKKKLVEKKKVN